MATNPEPHRYAEQIAASATETKKGKKLALTIYVYPESEDFNVIVPKGGESLPIYGNDAGAVIDEAVKLVKASLSTTP